MRISKNFFLAVFTIFSFASAEASSDPTTATMEIKQMLQSNLQNASIDQNEKVFITFMLNDKNEVIVLSTSATAIEGSIKSILNYKVLNSNDLEKGKRYTLPLVLEK